MRVRGMLVGAIVTTALVPAAAWACEGPAAFEWHMESAIALGSGCSLAGGDTKIMAMGSDVSVIATRLAARLPESASDTALSTIENCGVRIPATLRAGYHLTQIEHSLVYGVAKSAGTTAVIDALSGFAMAPPVGLSIELEEGAISARTLSASQKTPLLIADSCGASDLSAMFRADVAITANRTSTGETIEVGAVGVDLRYDMTLTTPLCPPPPMP